MRIFEENKIREIYAPDLEHGKLVSDKLFVKHHNAVLQRDEVGHEVVLQEYPNGGKDIEWIVDIPAIEAKDAWDEYEDIFVYIPYTQEELKEILREKRVPLLFAFDKWEKAVLRGREQDDYMIMSWYKSLLNLEEGAFNNIPLRVKYYL